VFGGRWTRGGCPRIDFRLIRDLFARVRTVLIFAGAFWPLPGIVIDTRY
jgi:hypothetical protein